MIFGDCNGQSLPISLYMHILHFYIISDINPERVVFLLATTACALACTLDHIAWSPTQTPYELSVVTARSKYLQIEYATSRK